MYELDYNEIIEAVEDATGDRDALYLGYSGRGMYGSECFGIVCSLGELLVFVESLSTRAALSSSDANVGEWIDRAQSDSMGISTIWYFPGATIVNAPDEDESEERSYVYRGIE